MQYIQSFYIVKIIFNTVLPSTSLTSNLSLKFSFQTKFLYDFLNYTLCVTYAIWILFAFNTLMLFYKVKIMNLPIMKLFPPPY
jgi:hypothetical protein